ncbi:MAG: ferrochelatase [Opitutaceae bacterium]|nr:ferrochelatase [Opitutaceae bacterium]|tara:strand:- start:10495 stop:11514 length:1020 start_codon:yes stop_codon:yes gene_type:complete
MAQKAVLILNLGSPDSTEVYDVRRYLKEFLLDERVIDSSPLARNLLVRGIILPTRPQKTAAAYRKVWTDDGSPLIVTSKTVQQKVQEKVDVPIELAMRYGSPTIPEAIYRLNEQDVQDLFIMPMYPHYAMSSYETVLVRVHEEIKEQSPTMTWTVMQPFYKDDDYIHAMVENARPHITDDLEKVLFSFHGIPERHLRKADSSHAHCMSVPDCCNVSHPAQSTCYRHQCFETVRAFTKKIGLEMGQYSISFQSRLTREPWLRPYTDHVLEALPKQGVKRLAVICPAFVTDCLETLEEIEMEGRKEFLAAGGEYFTMIPCLNDHPAWISTLVNRIRDWAEN